MVAAVLSGGRERPYTVQLDKGRPIWTQLPGTSRNKAGVAFALNDSGTVAGWLTGKGAAMWRTQVRPLRTIPIASNQAAQATSIDAAGNVAGFDPTGAKQAAFWPASGSAPTLPGLGGRRSQARGVVAAGAGEDIVVGSASTKHNVEQAAAWSLHRAHGRWTSSKPTALGVLSGSLYSRAYAANQSGWVVGYLFHSHGIPRVSVEIRQDEGSQRSDSETIGLGSDLGYRNQLQGTDRRLGHLPWRRASVSAHSLLNSRRRARDYSCAS